MSKKELAVIIAVSVILGILVTPWIALLNNVQCFIFGGIILILDVVVIDNILRNLK